MKRPEAPSERSRVRRIPRNAAYDSATIAGILDAGFLCHVAFVHAGAPVVLPMLYGRRGRDLLLHGSSKSRLLLDLGGGAPLCLSVTLVDGLVLARSAFNHSLNYRSVVVHGRGETIDEPGEKLAALERLSEHVLPRRWAESRPPNERELAATLVVRVPWDEASAKVRRGPPDDDEEDLGFPVWAGVLPLALTPGTPEPAPDLVPAAPGPGASVLEWAGLRSAPERCGGRRLPEIDPNEVAVVRTGGAQELDGSPPRGA